MYVQEQLDDVRRKLGEPVAARPAPKVAAAPVVPAVPSVPAAAVAVPVKPVAPPRDLRAEAVKQLEAQYAGFERQFNAAKNSQERVTAVEQLDRWIRFNENPALPRAEAGDWVLRRMTDLLRRHLSESAELVIAFSDDVVSRETLNRALPADIQNAVREGARRIQENYAAGQAVLGDIQRLLPRAQGGDGASQLALGLAYLKLPDANDRWAHAVHWLTQANNARVPGAYAPLKKLADEVNARLHAAAAAKDVSALLAIYRQKAASPLPDAADGALAAGRLLSDRVSGRDQNIPEGVKLLAQAATAGKSEAAYELGLLYVLNEDQPIDEAEALRWFRQAGSLGEEEAAAWIALLEPTLDRATRRQLAYEIGGKAMRSNPKVNADFRAAGPWLRFAARLGHPAAMTFVASVEKDAEKKRDLYVKAAEAGSVLAMEQLAYLVRKSDPKNAREWYLRAAQAGSVLGQESAGWMLLKGEGGPVDLAGARDWLGKAAAQKSGYAMFYLGQMEANGTGAPRNDAEAVKWWTSASAAGSTDAQYWLGVFYKGGRGVKQDPAKARELFTTASKNGSELAKKALEDMDAITRALTVLKVATTLEQDRAGAAAGNAQSMYLMGERYETGDGVPLDWAIAVDWYRKAAAAGHKDAGFAAADLDAALSRDKPAPAGTGKPANAAKNEN